jgi:sortase A
MATNPARTRKKSNDTVIGGQWLPNLLTWGGVLLMLTGGILAYPTLQGFLAPPDAQSLEFTVTLAPAPTATSQLPVILPETEILVTSESPSEPQAQATEVADLEIAPTATAVVPSTATPAPTSTAPAEAEAVPTAAPEPTVPPTPMPTMDPTRLLPTRLSIPAIDLDAPIAEAGWETKEINGQLVSSWIVPNSFTAGWHKTSALPGHIGNTVLNGHHNIYGEVFRDLVDLEPGDLIIVYSAEKEHFYSVAERHILKEKGESVEVRTQNAQWIAPTEDERLTMVTCWPYTNNTHRLIIVATPIQPEHDSALMD